MLLPCCSLELLDRPSVTPPRRHRPAPPTAESGFVRRPRRCSAANPVRDRRPRSIGLPQNMAGRTVADGPCRRSRTAWRRWASERPTPGSCAVGRHPSGDCRHGARRSESRPRDQERRAAGIASQPLRALAASTPRSPVETADVSRLCRITQLASSRSQRPHRSRSASRIRLGTSGGVEPDPPGPQDLAADQPGVAKASTFGSVEGWPTRFVSPSPPEDQRSPRDAERRSGTFSLPAVRQGRPRYFDVVDAPSDVELCSQRNRTSGRGARDFRSSAYITGPGVADIIPHPDSPGLTRQGRRAVDPRSTTFMLAASAKASRASCPGRMASVGPNGRCG